MPTQKWNNLKHKIPPDRRARLKQEALAEYDRMGYAAVRKARAQTQTEMARTLGISQASLSAIESRTDLRLSTLARYIRALGGELEIRAVFPEATFNLDPSGDAPPPDENESQTPAAKRARAHKSSVAAKRKPAARSTAKAATHAL